MQHPSLHPPVPEEPLLFGELRDADAERAFRTTQRARNASTFTLLVLVSIFVHVAMAFNDAQLAPSHFHALVALRVASSVAALFLGWRAWKTDSHLTRDKLVCAWAIMTSLVTIVVSASRPAGYLGFAAPLGILLFVYFVVLPLPLRLQLVPAGLLVVGHGILMSLASRGIDPAARNSLLVTFVACLFVGFEASRRAHTTDRRQFEHLRNESALRERLETALAEVRTLRGIVPICAHCKAIRDQEGKWDRFESYVMARTHAQFSHGICPTCLDEHFPEPS